MKREQTLRGRTAFEKVFRGGRRFDGRLVRCYALVESGSRVRAGFVVPRRKLNAVQRNRVKRLMREAFMWEQGILADRLQRSELSASLLFIFRPATTV
ncbi:MAG: ribonuclease P protein component, partial [Bacteroidota bacterium]